jgi:hypothetical protein
MRNFKFFRGYGGTLDMIDDTARATASFNDDTPEGHMNRRRLYHTNLPEYNIQQQEIYRRLREDDVISQQQYNLNRDTAAEQGERLHRDLNDNPIRLFQATATVTVNPTLWTKVKIFGTRVNLVLIETWKLEPIGVVVVSILLTMVTITGIAKILSIW